MPIESKFHRVAPDDPTRCQAVHKMGQCQYQAVEGSSYCAMHGGSGAARQRQQEMKRKYQLLQWQARTQDFSDDDDIKSLREEVGILRMTLEQVIKQCNTPMDIMLYSAKIGDLVSRIEKVVTSCNRLETSSGMLLDKSAALTLAAKIVEIISQFVTDADAVEGISAEIVDAIVGLNKETPE